MDIQLIVLFENQKLSPLTSFCCFEQHKLGNIIQVLRWSCKDRNFLWDFIYNFLGKWGNFRFIERCSVKWQEQGNIYEQGSLLLYSNSQLFYLYSNDRGCRCMIRYLARVAMIKSEILSLRQQLRCLLLTFLLLIWGSRIISFCFLHFHVL